MPLNERGVLVAGTLRVPKQRCPWSRLRASCGRHTDCACYFAFRDTLTMEQKRERTLSFCYPNSLFPKTICLGVFMPVAVLPPGPKGKFLTGNIGDMRRDALAFFSRCAREYGDVACFRMGLTRIYLISQPRLIEDILITHSKNFTKHFGIRVLSSALGNGLLTSEGEFWRRQRRLIQPAFSRERITRYASIMVELTDRLTAGWRDGATREMQADMTRLTLEIIARAMFGADVSAQAVVVGESVGIMAEGLVRRFQSIFRLPPVIPTPSNLRHRQCAQRIDAILYDIIRNRRASKEFGDDLLGMLIRACDEDDGTQMTDQQLRDEAITLFVAGHDTTALTLTWGLYLLARHPEAAGALEKELDQVLAGRAPGSDDLPRLRYTEMVVREIMRLYPAAYVIGREALAPFDAGAYRIPAGATILMSQWVVHRDPRWFDEPERFRPERWADGLERRLPKFAYFPFGGGPRVCIGNHFALIEAVLALAAIARNWRASVPAGEGPVSARPLVTLRPSRPVNLTVHRRIAFRS
jgi:cytochrome P450